MVPKVIPLTDTHPQPQESKEICVSHSLSNSHSLSQIPVLHPGSSAWLWSRDLAVSQFVSPGGL